MTPNDKESALTVADYEEVLADHRRLVRELDVLINGEEGAAKQASLCDIVAQLSAKKRLNAESAQGEDATPALGTLESAMNEYCQFVEDVSKAAGMENYDHPQHVIREVLNMRVELHRLKREGYAPDGWKLVPTEPTEEMINLGHTALDYLSARAHPMNNFTMRAKYCYKQMLAAAPTPEGDNG